MEHKTLLTLPATLLFCLALLAILAAEPSAAEMDAAGDFAVPSGVAAEPSDSLAFAAKRRQILERNPGERSTLILEAAEDLARDGYYAEALDLIFSLEDPKTAAAEWDPDSDFTAEAPVFSIPPTSGSLPLAASGYVQTALEYEQWQGLDTAVSARVRTKLEWDPRGRLLDRISSVFQGSERNAYFDVSAKGAAWRRMLKFEGSAQAEKRLWQTYGDSLDRFYLQARLEGNTRALGKPISVVTPVFAEAQRYRNGRFGSRSYRTLGATPGVEAISGDLRKSMFLSWDLRQTEYPSAKGDGNFRNGPVASGEWYGNRLTIDAETRLQTTRYSRDTSLYRLKELETRAGAFVRAWGWLRAGIRTYGVTETTDYRDTVYIPVYTPIQATYRLQGSSWMVQPQLIFEWTPAVSATLSLAYTQARNPILTEVDGYRLQFGRFMEESYDDWKPAVGVTVLTKAIFFTLSANYEENWIPYNADYILGSSRGFGVNCDVFWKIRPWFEVDFSGIAAQGRDFGILPGRVQSMLSLSLGLTSRFQ